MRKEELKDWTRDRLKNEIIRLDREKILTCRIAT